MTANGNAASREAVAAGATGPQSVAGTDAPRPADADQERLVEIDTQGDRPLVVREKFHAADPMGIDQALFEMELVGHDFFLFTDKASGLPSVVYRRRGYQYGVIRLTDAHAPVGIGADPMADVSSS
jgi:hypothetical protein